MTGWVKTITKTGSSTTFSNTMLSNAGTPITNFACRSLARSTNTDTYAAGTSLIYQLFVVKLLILVNEGANVAGAPVVYVQYAGSSAWTLLSSSGLPTTGSTFSFPAMCSLHRLVVCSCGRDHCGHRLVQQHLPASLCLQYGVLPQQHQLGCRVQLSGGAAGSRVVLGAFFFCP